MTTTRTFRLEVDEQIAHRAWLECRAEWERIEAPMMTFEQWLNDWTAGIVADLLQPQYGYQLVEVAEA